MSEMPTNGGRVTTKEFYEALLKQNEAMSLMDRRLVGRLDEILESHASFKESMARTEGRCTAIENKLDGKGGLIERVDANARTTKENSLDIVKSRNLNATLTAFLTAVATFIGWNR